MAGNSNKEEIGGFTSGELKLASWWVPHRMVIRKTGFGTLIAIAVLAWGYTMWSIVDAYVISYPRESRITRDIALNDLLLASIESDTPKDVSVSDVSVFQTTGNRYDMAVEILNPNEQWWAEFSYRFSLSGELTPQRTGYILPTSKRIVTELGFTPTSRGGKNATLAVENVRWHRVDPQFVGASYTDFAKKRLMLAFENITYDTGITFGSTHVGQTSFTLVNNASYGFWSTDLIIRLYRGNAPVAITKIGVEKLKPGERRPMQVIWTDNLPGITKTEIIPQVNLLDPKAYLSAEYFR